MMPRTRRTIRSGGSCFAQMKMSRGPTGLAVAVALVAGAVSAPAQDVPPCRSRSLNVEHVSNPSEATAVAGSLCVQGNPARIHLEVHQTTIAAALAALATVYDVSFSSSLALDDIRDGLYAGSLRQVIARLLSSYNYVIKSDRAGLDVDIYGKIGERAIPAPIASEVPEEPERRPAARVSRTR
jgi:hypothetical protein